MTTYFYKKTAGELMLGGKKIYYNGGKRGKSAWERGRKGQPL